ncbi:MAG: hypothetical protein KIT61_06525 [Pyrinomonadaceae bacterium]|nr:hypothetical protein [Pyrinomonadaceae bacterium]
MKRDNLVLSLASLSLVLAVGLGCNSLSKLSGNGNASANTNSTTSNTASPSNTSASNTNSASTTAPNVEKADFTMTSEQLDQEFTRKGVKDSDLEKYSNKTIAVSGRVEMLVKEKKGTTQPWVTLAAPGLGHGVSCYFDDENVKQLDMLKEDAMVKVQGYQDSFIVPEISPMLKHCVVLEGAK